MRFRFMSQVLAICLLAQVGCTSSLWKSGVPGEPALEAEQQAQTETRLIGDFTRPVGMNYFKVENVGLVTNLLGTGSDPVASGHRATLLGEMQSHKVDSPNRLLASPNTLAAGTFTFLNVTSHWLSVAIVFSLSTLTPSLLVSTSSKVIPFSAFFPALLVLTGTRRRSDTCAFSTNNFLPFSK